MWLRTLWTAYNYSSTHFKKYNNYSAVLEIPTADSCDRGYRCAGARRAAFAASLGPMNGVSAA